MKTKESFIKSGFTSLDLVTGGYPAGSTNIINCADADQSCLSRFIINQIKKSVKDNRQKVLLISIGKDYTGAAKNIIAGEDEDSIRALMGSDLYISTIEGDRYPCGKLVADLRQMLGEKDKEFDLIIIDGAEMLTTDDLFLTDITEILKGTGTAVIMSVSGTNDRLSNKRPIPAQNREYTLNTDVYGRVQMSVISKDGRQVIDDLYGLRHESAGIHIIEAERIRQQVQEGFSTEHDRKHTNGELANAAAAYALTEDQRELRSYGRGPECRQVPAVWPFEPEWYKPTPGDRVRELAKAGGFIAAEIDRIIAEKRH